MARGGKQEVAGAASTSATPRLCSSSWQRRKRTKEEEVGWAGWGNWAGSGKQVSGPGGLQVMFPSLFYNSVLFYLFSFSAICF